MALAKNFSIERTDWATLSKIFSTRGLVKDGRQVEVMRVTKLTGDTSGSVALTGVQRPFKVTALPIIDSAGAAVTTEPTMVELTFTHTNNTTIAFTGLGDWVSAILFIEGRSYKYA